MAEREQVALLLRRATFGPTAAEVDAAERAGYAATVDRLLTPRAADAGARETPPPDLGTDPAAALTKGSTREQRQQARQEQREQARALVLWWLDRMVAADDQLGEKLVFFWHGHWATSVQKVRSAVLMRGQLDTLRRYGRGELRDLATAMVTDPALILWLDGHRNSRKAPNENLARELMELFTLGPGHYTEDDVQAAARALTGWTVDRAKGTAEFVRRRHDPAPQAILGETAAYDARSLVALLCRQPAARTFLAGRLWRRFASEAVAPPADLTGTAAVPLLRAAFTQPAFAGTAGQHVKEPVEWAVGAMRQLGVRPSALGDQKQKQLLAALGAMGQVPLRPPSVGGWPYGAAWLTTSSLQARARLARLIAAEATVEVRDEDELARLLAVDAWSARTSAALKPIRNAAQRLTAALISPEYTVC
ncbi:DUF1800 family protein [Phytohabitans flavus]|uniref:DUF1800 domain-containing protein n=1 Tax=Phytohabitans flavus TaxID=1076124 RepID=A0A6F8XP02_9ACTN|nr:DUF1800 domain-containing protein [Phytohabitans flavus]BCB75546.1 hypothetical protein Pflav_019560 [Phytohabitans flavus]